MNPLYKHRTIFSLKYALLLAVLGAVATGCGPAPANPKLNVSIFGWGPKPTGGVGWVDAMPNYQSAATVQIKVSQPAAGTLLAVKKASIAAHNVTAPKVKFGKDLRLDVEILDNQGGVIASGASPLFNYSANQKQQTYRLMVAPVDKCVPAGSMVVNPTTRQPGLVQSTFDYRGAQPRQSGQPWLGRVGQAAVPLKDGRVMIVGGGDPARMPQPGKGVQLSVAYNDIQIYNPATGYFTVLGEDDAAIAAGITGKDFLHTGRAFATVTPLGNDRFLVVGGLTVVGQTTSATNSIELINLNAPPGSRVQTIPTSDGNQLALNQPRAYHTATFRTADGAVVVAGGIGNSSGQADPTDVLQTVEIINVKAGSITGATMTTARAQQAATLLPDGKTVWFMGGRTGSQVLNSAEVLPLGAAQGQATTSMNQARFDMAAIPISPDKGNTMMLIGGFTSMSGAVTGSYEFLRTSQDFANPTSWKLAQARGGLKAVELPQSKDIVVFGGIGQGGTPINSVERLRFNGLTNAFPYKPDPAVQTNFFDGRYKPSATVMGTGQVLIVGGIGQLNGQTAALDNAEIYNGYDPVRGVLVQ